MNRTRWYEIAARTGYVAKGVVYGLVGGLAVASAVGASGSVGGSQNAVRTIGQQSYGMILLALTGVGLFAYAAWRMVQAWADPEGADEDDFGYLQRAGYGISSIAHAALGVAAFQMAFGSGGSSGGGGGSKASYLRDVMQIETVGSALVVGIGLAVLGLALRQLYKAFTGDFLKRLKTGEMSGRLRTAAKTIGRAGLGARGVVFLIIGGALVHAGITTDASEYVGVGGALRSVAEQPFGAVLLVLVAGGLASYGVHQLVLAKYRRVPA